MTLLDIPNTTDWISAIASAIGVPAAIFGFFQLFIRDKDRQEEIRALTILSKSQTDSLEEMKKMLLETQKQTQQFEYQTNHLKELNDIFKEYFTAVSSSIAENKEYKQNLVQLENRKRKAEIKPHFIFAGAMGQGFSGIYQIRLKNIGKTAYLKDLIVTNNGPIHFYKEFEENKMISENQEITISGQLQEGQQSVNVVDFEFEIIFEDADNNRYRQKVRRFNNGSSYKVEIPEEIA